MRISLHPHAIHDVTCLSVRLLSLRVRLSLVPLPLLPLLLHSLPNLCLAHHLQCPHRRGLKPLHSRTMGSIAPWRYTILSHRQRDMKALVHGDDFVSEWLCKGLKKKLETKMTMVERGRRPGQGGESAEPNREMALAPRDHIRS